MKVDNFFTHMVMAVIVLVLLALSVGTTEAAPLATMSSCSFSPTEGAPGTLIHARVNEWYSGSTVEVGLAVPIVPDTNQESVIEPMEKTLKLIGEPLASMLPVNVQAETTFRIPSKLPSGEPVPTHSLYLVCEKNNRIYMGEGPGPVLFTFTTGSLPATGQPFAAVGVIVALACIALIVGIRLHKV